MPNNNTNDGSKGFAITSMVCGIVALVFCWTFWISLICAIIALVFGIIAIAKKKSGKGMAIAGVVTGGVSIAISAAIYALALAAINATVDVINNTDWSDTDWSSWLESLED